MNIASAIEYYLGQHVDFTSQVILEVDSSGNQTIKTWGISSKAQPTIETLETIYNNNKTILDIDAFIKGGHISNIVLDSGVTNTVATGYIDTLNVTSANWKAYLSYTKSLSGNPPHTLVTSTSKINNPLLTKYITSGVNVNLDTSCSLVIFNNTAINVNAYLPTITSANEGFIFHIKNYSRNATVYLYPKTSSNLIDYSAGYFLCSGASVTLAVCYDTQTYMILGSH